MYEDKEAEEKYLTLDQLGTVLRSLAEQLPGTIATQGLSKFHICTTQDG